MMATARPSDRSESQRLAIWLGALLWLAMLWVCTPVIAAEDPPGRVGRVTESQGQSWVYDADAGEWISLERNRPLTGGDRIAVDGNGRLELRVGSTSVRLAGGSELVIQRIDDERIDLSLQDGSVALRVRSPEVAREVELATAEGRFLPQGVGHFRVDRHDDTSVATAWIGELRFEAEDSALNIPTGRSAELWREGPNNATHYSWGEPAHDEFADWTARADREDERVASPNYVSPEMTGWEDLDRNGRWDTNPDYGPVWIPTVVVAGWAPYRFGHWALVRPWGWTWVDDAPWGFAPFHYGRWVVVGGHWCWAPGRWVARPVYAPALVAWIGGPQVSGHATIGGPPFVGWVPLAPREPYYPHYATGGSYWRAVNSAQLNLFPPNTPRRPPTGPIMYANQGVPGAVSVVPSNALVPRRPVAPVVAQVDPGVRNSFTNQPWRPHVPPPGVARPIAVPGNPTPAQPPAVIPRPPIRPPVPRPGGPPSPAVMGQPTAPPATTTVPEQRRERGPRAVVPPPPTTAQTPKPPQQRGPNTIPGQGQPRSTPPAQATATSPPQVAAPVRAPAMPAPTVQPPAPSPAQRRYEPSPGEPGGMRRGEPPNRSQAPQVRAAPAPMAGSPAPAARTGERVAPPQREAQRVPNQPAPAAQARVRAPEWQGHPDRGHMQ
jgi:hypothetical protein